MEELEQEFNYDKEYICDCMGWEPATAQKDSSSAGSAAGNGFTGEGRPSCHLIVILLSMQAFYRGPHCNCIQLSKVNGVMQEGTFRL